MALHCAVHKVAAMCGTLIWRAEPPMSIGKRRKATDTSQRESRMSQFEDRQKGQEAKFAFDAEKKFKAEARRNKLVGIWAAELMSLTGDEAKAYAAEVVAADFEEAGDEDVFRKVSADLKAKGLSIGDDVIRQKMAQLVQVANEQIAAEG
jgi:Uncharacterized conserved protein